jgi:hypothetical protein
MHFTVRGAATPDLLLRVINLLAQHGVEPDRVLIERRDDLYELSIEIGQAYRAEMLLYKLRAMVLVASAEVMVAA